MQEDYQQRFGGVGRVYGRAAMATLQQLHVCVIGIGGVGSWAAEALARSGVGEITLIDHDDLCETNINRQIHALDSTIGRSKVDVMAARIADIHPACRCHAVDDHVTSGNLARHLACGYDAVIDAIDSIRFKTDIIYYCKRNKIPVITTGGAGGLTDPTRIQVSDLTRTFNDPLAAKVRNRLRHDYGWTGNPKRRFGVDCVFSSEQPRYPRADGSIGLEKPGVHGLTLDCSLGYGSLSMVTASFGLTAAARILNRMMEKQHNIHE